MITSNERPLHGRAAIGCRIIRHTQAAARRGTAFDAIWSWLVRRYPSLLHHPTAQSRLQGYHEDIE